jgi:hypothetical protein
MSATIIALPGVQSPVAARGRARAASDPIFRVIAELRAAHEEIKAVFHEDDDEDADPDLADAATEREIAAELALWTTAPTSLQGLAALLALVGEKAPGCRDGTTVWEFAQGWTDKKLRSAVRVFPRFLALAVRHIAVRSAVDEASSPR